MEYVFSSLTQSTCQDRNMNFQCSTDSEGVKKKMGLSKIFFSTSIASHRLSMTNLIR